MRKSTNELMWEVFVESSNGGPVSTGGPLKGGSNVSSSSDEDAEDTDGDPYEDEEDELHGILKKCHGGDITPEEAHEHITKLMKGSEEDAEDKNTKRNTVQQATDAMHSQFTKHKSAANVKRPQPDRSVEGVKRNTSGDQKGI
jgi:hypothetical protein